MLLNFWARLRLRLTRGCRISIGARIKGIGNISFGRGVGISRFTVINATSGSIVLGNGVTIAPFVVMESRGGTIDLGEGSSINPFSVLYGHGGLRIGKDCIIASGAIFVPANHVYADVEKPIKVQGETRLGITLEDNVWIGSRVTVLDGGSTGVGPC